MHTYTLYTSELQNCYIMFRTLPSVRLKLIFMNMHKLYAQCMYLFRARLLYALQYTRGLIDQAQYIANVGTYLGKL